MPKTSNNTARRLAALALAVLLQGVAAPDALAQAGTAEPGVQARSWVLADAEDGEYLAGENVSERLSMGSILTVRELLAASLIASGNDAAYALAEHLGGEAGEDGFVERMNREVEALGLEDTRFQNPTGLDARGQYSSARDLAAMARAASEHPLFRELVATDYTTITTLDREIELVSTNELLFTYPPATGVKTGTTPGAGPSLVASAAAEDEAYISVILDSKEDRFAASIRALEHAFAAYDRTNLVEKGEQYTRADVPYRRGETVGLIAKESVEGLVGEAPEVRRETRVFEDLPASARPGTPLGEIVVEVDGDRVGETPLVANKGYDAASLWERVWYTVGGSSHRGVG